MFKIKPDIKKRKYLIYYAINLLTEPINNKIPIIENSSLVEQVIKKINIIYKQIKKNEIIKNRLFFNNSMTIQFEKTVKKLDKMNALMTQGIIPRK